MRLTPLCLAALVACGPRPAPTRPVVTHDVVIRHGLLVDGSGGTPTIGDLAIDGDAITALGDLGAARGRRELDATGLAVAPGFINMLSHAESSLILDGRAQSDLRQGVTLEIFGEGSMGPITATARDTANAKPDARIQIDWHTLGEYLDGLVRRGVSPNVASFVGTRTVRAYVLGDDARPPTAAELAKMGELVAQAMDEGALGLTTALMYAPDAFATTADLIALAKVAAARGGVFTAHIRDEGNHLDEALDEMIAIARAARIPVEIYHLKQAGRANWPKLDGEIAKIEAARKEGLAITADVYTYPAAATGLDAAMPRWVQAGGFDAWRERLRDPAIRAKVIHEMDLEDPGWDNNYAHAGPAGVLLVGFHTDALRPLIGKTLAEVAAARGKTPEETAMDLVIEDGSRVEVIYTMMTEDNIRKELALPWVSFGSDATAVAPEGVFLKSSVHPRAYGNVARLLGRYVREQRVLSLAEAVRKLTSLPAENLGLAHRGRLTPGYAADVAIFDPATIIDHATFEAPHQYATGVAYVLVNGVLVIDHGEPTTARPGRVVRGRGYKGR